MEKNWNQVLSLIKIRSGVDLFQELKRIKSMPPNRRENKI